MVDSQFREFLCTFYVDDPALIESIQCAHNIIFESFTDVSVAVLKAYNQILNITEIPTRRGNHFGMRVKLNDSDVDIVIEPSSNLSSKAYPPNRIILRISDLWRPLVLADLDTFVENASSTKHKYVILHELGHIYEFMMRDQTILNTQLTSMYNNRAKRTVSDAEYHNHRTETIANYTAIVLYRINEAIANHINDANEMYSYVIRAIHDDIERESVIKSLNRKSWKNIKYRIARIIGELNKNSTGTNIKQIITNNMGDL